MGIKGPTGFVCSRGWRGHGSEMMVERAGDTREFHDVGPTERVDDPSADASPADDSLWPFCAAERSSALSALDACRRARETRVHDLR